MTKRLTTQEIVREDCKREGINFEYFYAGLHAKIASNEMRVMRFGNTLFAYYLLAPGETNVYIITVDKVPDLIKALKNFYAAMKVAGFKRSVTDMKDKSLIGLLKRAGIKFTTTPIRKDINGVMQSGYRLVVEDQYGMQ